MTTDIAISAAFETLLDQIDTARRTAEDKSEIAYWRTQHNGFAKAAAHFSEGVRARWTGASYLVRSATRPESIVHRVRLVGGIWLCSCECTSFCWHSAMIAAYDHAGDEVERGNPIAAMAELFT